MVLIRDVTTFEEAYETLGALAELGKGLNWDDVIATEGLETEQPGLAWLEHQEVEHLLTSVRRLFSLMLQGLHRMERQQVSPRERQEVLQRIKGIMAVVGEAAVGLDEGAQQFFGFPAGTIMRLREYDDLRAFYRAVLMREIEQGLIFGKPTWLRDVTADHNYELAYLKREDGRSFLTPQMKENLTLAADFELYGAKYRADDPLVRVRVWIDEMRRSEAQQIMGRIRPLVNRQVQGAEHAALTALSLAANQENALMEGHEKCSIDYFDDFIRHLRAAGESELKTALCQALYTCHGESEELQKLIGTVKGDSLAEHLEEEYEELKSALAHHPNGPLFKLIDLMRQEEREPFDPLKLGNIPSQLCQLQFGPHRVQLLRLPSPTLQAYIHSAHFEPLYREFAKVGEHAVINLQDRLSWREGARAAALEEMGAWSLAVDSDFYHQKGEHRNTNNSEQFLDHFFEELQGPHYLLPIEMFDFIDDLLGGVHRTFFGGKKEMTARERKALIDIVYLFIALKLIEMVQPDTFAFADKDGVDASGVQTGLLMIGLAVLRGQIVEDEQALHEALFYPALLVRERSIDPGRMERFLYSLERLERGAKRRHLLDEEVRALYAEHVI